MAKGKKKEEPVTPKDLLTVSGKELRLSQEAHAKMTVYAEQVEHKLAEMTKERDAYKKAKEENDERFMRERDEARAELAEHKEWAEEELANAQRQANAAVEDLRLQAAQWKADYERACKLVADMHAAAVGEVRGPSIGPVEDVAALHLAAKQMGQQLKELLNKSSTSPQAGVLGEVRNERVRQDAKWGEQNHPDGTCAGPNGAVIAKQHADAARSVCDQMAKIGKLTWAHILTEELMEAYAETDESKLRKELIQTAAVAVSWIEAIDRRINGRTSGQ